MARKANTPIQKIRDRFQYYRSEVETLKKTLEEKTAYNHHLKGAIGMMTAKCSCGHLLHIIGWGEKDDRFIMACNNIRCHKYRQPAGMFRKSSI